MSNRLLTVLAVLSDSLADAILALAVMTALAGALVGCTEVPDRESDLALAATLPAPPCPPVDASRVSHTRKLSALGGANVGSGSFQVIGGMLTGNWAPAIDGDLLGVPLPVSAGERIESIALSVYGSTDVVLRATALAQDDAFHVGAVLRTAVSINANSTQMIRLCLSDLDDGIQTDVPDGMRSYWLQVKAIGDAGDARPFVGPISLVVSTAL